jgi:uncharacterized RDD family membrane protein YckC
MDAAEHDEVTVRSPEGVELSLPIAGPTPRMAAYAIDLVLVWVVMAGLLFLMVLTLPLGGWLERWFERFGKQAPQPGSEDALLMMLPFFILIIVLQYFSELLYFGLWEAVSRGRTVGKHLLGLRVVGMEGQPLDAKAAMVRNLLRAVDVLPSGYAIGLVTVITSRYGQRLGDHAAGTLVIRTDKVARPAELRLPGDLEPLPLSREQLGKLGPPELALARGTLRRLQSARGAQRADLLRDVSHALATRLALDADAEPDPLRLLQRILLAAERRK